MPCIAPFRNIRPLPVATFRCILPSERARIEKVCIILKDVSLSCNLPYWTLFPKQNPAHSHLAWWKSWNSGEWTKGRWNPEWSFCTWKLNQTNQIHQTGIGGHVRMNPAEDGSCKDEGCDYQVDTTPDNVVTDYRLVLPPAKIVVLG